MPLGALQLPAKALEIWFVIVMGSFVWDLMMLLARDGGTGLPIRYLTTFVEYADPKALFAPSFWTSASARADAKGP
jgi:hypothetical protein